MSGGIGNKGQKGSGGVGIPGRRGLPGPVGK